jgi:hypothetical protein
MAYTTGIKRLKSYKGYGGKQSSVGSIPSIEFSVTQEGGTPEQILQEILKRKPSSYEVNWFKTSGQAPGVKPMGDKVIGTYTVPKTVTVRGKRVEKGTQQKQQYRIPQSWLVQEFKGGKDYDFSRLAPDAKKTDGEKDLPKVGDGKEEPKKPGKIKGRGALKIAGDAFADSFKSPTGQMAWLTVLGVGLDYAQYELERTGKASEYADKKIAELEAKEKEGTLGRDRDLEKAEMAEMMEPVRAIASEGRRQAEAVQAGMGETRSARAMGRLREDQAKAVGEGIRQAGAVVSQRRAQRAAQEIGQLESLYQYKQQMRERAAARILGGVGMTAQQLGRIAAASAENETFSFPRFKEMMGPEFAKLDEKDQYDYYMEIKRIQGIEKLGKASDDVKDILGLAQGAFSKRRKDE